MTTQQKIDSLLFQLNYLGEKRPLRETVRIVNELHSLGWM